MLIKAKTIEGYKLLALDGELGTVEEFYFDDHHWGIRYLVANTGNWLTGRQVLISPYALIGVNKKEQSISTSLTKKQIEGSPSLESDKPVSQQFEDVYYGYYGWPTYYNGPYLWGSELEIMKAHDKRKEFSKSKRAWDPHLRSTQVVSSYHIQATDGEIGHVEDFIIDDETTWAIRYLVVDTKNWWLGKKVLVSPEWIKKISWDESKIFVNLTRESIKQSPEYTDESLLTRDYETGLYKHYNHQGYWEKKSSSKEHSR
ncbi:MAG: PRC-barrel domain-containing protein [Oligoflexia bacterium]|nr:PRC-barrel domain-containing protein [Oligoflexia bacterium]